LEGSVGIVSFVCLLRRIACHPCVGSWGEWGRRRVCPWVGWGAHIMMPEPGLATSGAQQAVRWICSRWPWEGSGKMITSVGARSGCFRFRVVWLVIVCEVGRRFRQLCGVVSCCPGGSGVVLLAVGSAAPMRSLLGLLVGRWRSCKHEKSKLF
jgi:hypothetical protein